MGVKVSWFGRSLVVFVFVFVFVFVVLVLVGCSGIEYGALQAPSAQPTIKVFFVTNRDQLGDLKPDSPASWFGRNRHAGGLSDIVYGSAEIVIPEGHRPGRPFPKNTEAIGTPLNDAQFFDGVERTAIAESSKPGSKEALLFVHGYNNDFWVALRRTAQIAHDIKFEGVPICFSWPANGGFWGVADYPRDLSDAEWSGLYLAEFIQRLIQKVPDLKLNAISHSMGGRVLLEAIPDLERLSRGQKIFEQVVLAAPDVDAQVFEHRGPRLAGLATRVTLYASNRDRPLRYSRTFHGYLRAGDASDGQIVVARNVRSIDVSIADTNELGESISSMGHGAIAENVTVLNDLKAILQGVPEERRSLKSTKNRVGQDYWEMLTEKPATTAAK